MWGCWAPSHPGIRKDQGWEERGVPEQSDPPFFLTPSRADRPCNPRQFWVSSAESGLFVGGRGVRRRLVDCPKMRAVTAGPSGASDCSLAFRVQGTKFPKMLNIGKSAERRWRWPRSARSSPPPPLPPSLLPDSLPFSLPCSHSTTCPTRRPRQAPPGPRPGGAALGEGSSHQSQPPSPTSCISRKFLRPYRLASYFLQSTSSPKSGMWGSLRVAWGRGETGKLLRG